MTAFSMADIRAASARLAGKVVRTPLLNSPMLDQVAGCEIYVKAESLQKTGAFKFRGAMNKIAQLEPDALARGVVAFSSGNHGHAVAAAAALSGARAVIVLPNTAPKVKIDSARWWGAEIILYDPAKDRREDIAQTYMDQGLTLVPPFDDHAIMAGQGTAGLEMTEQLAELGKSVDAVIMGSSGGGLSSGVITAVRDVYPEAEAWIVEPQGYDKMARSFAQGGATGNDEEAKTVMDSLSGRLAGERTYAVLRDLGAKAVNVTDDEAMAAVYACFRYLKLVVEPGGCAGLAAVLAGRVPVAGKRVAVVCSGGNIDAALYSRILTERG